MRSGCPIQLYKSISNSTFDSLFVFQKMDPKTFTNVDFKFVDGQPDNQLLKGLKVWPVTEVRTVQYGIVRYSIVLTFIITFCHVFLITCMS